MEGKHHNWSTSTEKKKVKAWNRTKRGDGTERDAVFVHPPGGPFTLRDGRGDDRIRPIRPHLPNDIKRLPTVPVPLSTDKVKRNSMFSVECFVIDLALRTTTKQDGSHRIPRMC